MTEHTFVYDPSVADLTQLECRRSFMVERRRTSTYDFGVGRCESPDASALYERFRSPEVSNGQEVLPPKPVVDSFVCGDSRAMEAVEDGSVALVVTSPPYFAGKAYEEELQREVLG